MPDLETVRLVNNMLTKARSGGLKLDGKAFVSPVTWLHRSPVHECEEASLRELAATKRTICHPIGGTCVLDESYARGTTAESQHQLLVAICRAENTLANCSAAYTIIQYTATYVLTIMIRGVKT